MTVAKLIEELKACPFCGGEAKMTIYKSLYMVECTTCGATIGRSINLNDDPDTLNTRDEVMEAWNLRDVESKPERTCRPVIEDETKVCSNCGYDIDGYGWRYCPNCGARIVEQ